MAVESSETGPEQDDPVGQTAANPSLEPRQQAAFGSGRICYFVLGMHRSGTSSITGALVKLGAAAPAHLLGASVGNETGHWESQPLIYFHDELLASVGSRWDDWRKIRPDWYGTPVAAQFKTRANQLLDEEFGDAPVFVFKDPRNCRIARFWLGIFAERGIAPRIVLPIRSPLEVARSHRARDGFPLRKGLLLWLRHVLDAEAASRDLPRAVVEYDAFLKDWQSAVAAMERAVGAFPANTDLTAAGIDRFLRDDLKHQSVPQEELARSALVHAWVEQVYEAMRELARNPSSNSAREALDRVRAQFDEAAALFGGVLADAEASLTETEQVLREAEQARGEALAQLGAAQQERDEQATEVARLAEEAVRLAAAHAELGHAREEALAQLAATQRERDAEAAEAARLAAAYAELDRARGEALAQLAATQQERDAQAAEVARLAVTIAAAEQAQYETRNQLALAEKEIISHATDDTELNQTPAFHKSAFSVISKRGVFYGLYRIYKYVPISRKVKSFLHRRLQSASPEIYRRVTLEAFNANSIFISKSTKKPYSANIERLNAECGNPYFSVIIPIYDRTDVVMLAIDSILNQSFRSFELILVMDGSPDETRDVVFGYASHPLVRVFSFPDSSGTGVRGRNKGILEARGEFIAFLDSDDMAEPKRLEKTYSGILNSKADVIYGAWRAIIDGSREVDGLTDGQVVVSPQCTPEQLINLCVPCQSTVSVRRSCLLQAGLLKPHMRYREDHELWARLGYFGASFLALPEPLASLRIHSGNNELNFKADDQQWAAAVAKEYRIRGPLPKKIVFFVAGISVSGGAAVVLHHARALAEFGHDVSIVNIGDRASSKLWASGWGVPIYHRNEIDDFSWRNIDIAIATFWTTVATVIATEARRKIYLVQSDERLFYDDEFVISKVQETYESKLEFIAIAHWIGEFLQKEFGKECSVVENGIDPAVFFERPGRRRKDGYRVLIEGPVTVPWKGLQAAYSAVSGLDVEIWVVTSDVDIPRNWNVNRSYCGVSPNEMADIYSSCDILVKLSEVESFCLPALEAMACGCAVVIGKVRGGIDYLRDGDNSIVVGIGDIEAARDAVAELLRDRPRYERIVRAGKDTASSLTLSRSVSAMIELIGG